VVTGAGLGLAALGRPAYITLGRDADLGADRGVEAMERRCHGMLDAAYGAGVRYIDTARSYGRAEAFLASWLGDRHLTASDITVGSKWGYRYVGDWRMDTPVHEAKDHSLAMFRRQLPETVALLGTHLGLYQVHSATLESGVLDDDAVLGALAGLRDGGIAVGLTVSGPRQAEVVWRALEVAVDGVNPFSTVQATWNLLEPSAGAALAAAHAHGLGVIVKEALANGRLVGSGDGDVGVVAEVAALHDTTLEAVAFAAAAAPPWADVVLSGAVTADQLDANLSALDLELGDDDRAQVDGAAEDPEDYWQRRSDLPWR
jgi:aryl-alcohol dehydrogenase-like predicted oxidoreductase